MQTHLPFRLFRDSGLNQKNVVTNKQPILQQKKINLNLTGFKKTAFTKIESY